MLPEELRTFELEVLPEIPFWKVPDAIERIDARIEKLNGSLADLPTLHDNLQHNAFGYHSDFKPSLETEATREVPLWQLDIYRKYVNKKEVYLALVPAADHSSGTTRERGYGFPKRFMIEVFHPDGRVEVAVDFRAVDFPDPGRLPVIFKLPSNQASRFRISVYKGVVKGYNEFFALGEVVTIINNEFATTKSVRASSSYESKPYWSAGYLNDWRLGLGLPTQNEASRQPDFSLRSEALRNESLRIRIDLGERKLFPWLNLYPALPLGGISLPGYGFPRKLRIEVRSNPSDTTPHLYYESTEQLNPGNDWLRIRGSEKFGRYVDIICSDFPEYEGVPVFSLGDILLNEKGINHAHSRPIELLGGFQGLEEEGASLSLLVDQCVAGHELFRLVDWLVGLAARKPLERELQGLLLHSVQLESRKSFMIQTAVFSALSLASFCAIILFGYMVLSRRKAEYRLRKQICSDLHDELGSKMSTISLISEFMTFKTRDPDILERSRAISDTAGEMNSALRDVLWFTDTDTDTLEELVHRMAVIARKKIYRESLVLQLPDLKSKTSKRFNARYKRDIIYFFYEALNNATRHADASQICVRIECAQRTLKLMVEDNGKGFDLPSKSNEASSYNHKCYGLKNMQVRARRLKGRCSIESRMGRGTRIHLVLSF